MTVTVLHPAPSVDLFDDAPVAALSDDELGMRLTNYAGQIAALTARFLELLAEFDSRTAWGGHGILSCAHWLTWRTGMSYRTAQDHVRIARALPGLPRLKEAFAKGELTYSKIRALTRVATVEREVELLAFARAATAAQVERLVRAMRTLDGEGTPTDEKPIESSGRWRWNIDGTLSVTLKLSALDGAAFLAAAVRAEYERTRTVGDPDLPADALTPEGSSGTGSGSAGAGAPPRDLWRHVPSDIAPAVRVMADAVRTGIDMPAIAPGAEVVIHTHVNGAADATLAPDPHLDDGPALTDAEVCEAQCGATVSDLTVEDGVRLRWGRDRRYPTRRLVRFITQRDRCCQHPGCGRTRHLHIHHVRAWAAGGTTDPDNLILLCSKHHRALHRGEFRINARGRQRFTFHQSDGTLLEVAPEVPRPQGWRPDPTIAPDATVPTSGGKLHLGYATDVLYRTWDYQQQRTTMGKAA